MVPGLTPVNTAPQWIAGPLRRPLALSLPLLWLAGQDLCLSCCWGWHWAALEFCWLFADGAENRPWPSVQGECSYWHEARGKTPLSLQKHAGAGLH